MATEQRPRFRELERALVDEILARNHVGRIAFSRGQWVDIVPVHYVYSEGWIYGRTSPGTKLESSGKNWLPVAFEVDEIEGLFEWRSVVVHGGFYVIRSEGARWEQEAWMKGLGLLRTLIPETFRKHDPFPGRTILFRVAVQEVTGREAYVEPAPDE